MPDGESRPLALARVHVANGSKLVDEQAARIAHMVPGSVEAKEAEALLKTMKFTLAMFLADLARLEAQAPDPSRPQPSRI